MKPETRYEEFEGYETPQGTPYRGSGRSAYGRPKNHYIR